MSIRIAWMYPDTLYLHGERGNALALKRIAAELGGSAELEKVDFETKDFDPMEYDILFFAAGEVSSFEAVGADMQRYMDRLKEFIESGRPVIATGTTMAMFGGTVRRTDGSETSGIGLIPVTATEREYVYGDDEQVMAQYHGKSFELVGNQIQMINISFAETDDFKSFGSVVYGMGNNGRDGSEGVVYRNSVFTSMLGPLLVNNPWLTAEIIRAAAASSGKKVDPEDPDFELEKKSLECKKKFIAEKVPGSMGL